MYIFKNFFPLVPPNIRIISWLANPSHTSIQSEVDLCQHSLRLNSWQVEFVAEIRSAIVDWVCTCCCWLGLDTSHNMLSMYLMMSYVMMSYLMTSYLPPKRTELRTIANSRDWGNTSPWENNQLPLYSLQTLPLHQYHLHTITLLAHIVSTP